MTQFPPEALRRPLLLQDWNQLTFLHWSYDPSIVRRLLPQGLELDTFEGKAWVGLVPFLIERTRPLLVPPVPWLSTFPETNVRTYVRGPGGGTGV